MKSKKSSAKQMKKKKLALDKSVMDRIREDDVRVQPKWQFMVGSFLLSFGMLSVTVLAIYLVSVSWYRIHMHSSLYYLWFGAEGQKAFWATFPWLFLLLASLSLYMGVRILKRFDVSYKVKWQYWLGGLVLGVLVTGILVDYVGVNKTLDDHKMAEPLYVKYDASQDWYKGEVEQVELRRMTVTTMESGHTVQVRWSERTRLPFGGGFEKGHWVIMVGDWQGGVFEAKGIEKVERP